MRPGRGLSKADSPSTACAYRCLPLTQRDVRRTSDAVPRPSGAVGGNSAVPNRQRAEVRDRGARRDAVAEAAPGVELGGKGRSPSLSGRFRARARIPAVHRPRGRGPGQGALDVGDEGRPARAESCFRPSAGASWDGRPRCPLRPVRARSAPGGDRAPALRAGTRRPTARRRGRGAGLSNTYPATMSEALVDWLIGRPSFRFTPVHHVFSSGALRLHGCARNVWTGRLSV